MSTEAELRVLCVDPDPRQRADAIRKLERICAEPNGFLSLESYATVRELCANSSTNVRLSALRILVRFAQSHGDHFVKNQRGFEIRLHDDVFSVVCHALNDFETSVRTEAAQMLGRLNDVTEAFLAQTLDKKIMNALKMSGPNGPRRINGAASWSTGKKLNESATDKPADDEEEQSIIPSGTCGAFVTALEDEFMSVRLAAVYSLGLLAAGRPEFARTAIDHLADMFNDEMQEVRFAAIKALTPMVIHGKLDQEQLYAVLNVLSDATADNRWALHELLSLSHLNDSGCIAQVLKALLESMHRFPTDRESIYRCLSAIGRHHALLVQPLIFDLFNLHPIFESQEQNVNDDYYLGRLILSLNAAAVHQPIRSLLPSYIARHYRFVRCATPTLVPRIDEYERGRKRALEVAPKPTTSIDCNLDAIYTRIVSTYTSESSAALFSLMLRDLNISENLEEKIAAPIRLLKTFCELLQKYDAAIRFQYDEIATLALIEESLVHIAQIRRLFAGIDAKLLVFVAEVSFQLHVQFLFIRLCLNPKMEARIRRLLSNEMEQLKNNYVTYGQRYTNEAMSFAGWLMELLSTKLGPKKMVTAPLNVDMIRQKLSENRLQPPPRIPHLRNCVMRTIAITDVSDGSGQQLHAQDHVHRFVANVPTGIQLTAQIFNLSVVDENNFRVEVTYPDEWHDYQKPQPFELERIDAYSCRLRMTVLLSADQWAEASEIRVSCGLLTSEKRNDDSAFLPFSAAISVGTPTARKTPDPHFVPLHDANRPSQSNLITVRIHPMARC
ncbi:hypothetical protein M3Y98_00688300 [Aphelenchoides besseyi]|nr:hypothetical protein M3Y98_00688300 [Aphelenchoides besseyi]KAI6209018.1 hypothetical protein M3Y96_00176600 [Aphelenchoides besseyi]